jgi:acyl transferase domain-containing protein/NAD(P)H-dependent flavin oxidoreductase YrpB (nitropropane dioxygenase family)
MEKFEIITLTPPSQINPSLAIAGSRAGGLGVLDLEFAANILHANDCIKKLSLYSRNPYGLRINCNQADLLSELMSTSYKLLQTVILTNPLSKEIVQTVDALKSKGLTVFLECISSEEAESGFQSGVDGIIAKGNEAGGRVSNDSTFVLLQRILKKKSMPIFAQGGIGLHTAAACYAAGASGVVLDSQLLLTRESPFPEEIKTRLALMGGTETIILGEDIGEYYRVCSRLGISAVKKMQEKCKSLYFENAPEKTKQSKWYASICEHVICDSVEDSLILIGQDIAFAKSFSRKHRTVGDIVQSIKQSISNHCRLAKNNNLLSEGSLLAVSHGTRYPIVQGPMARISDNPDFIAMVSDKGALPFFAAGWIKENELDTLLGKTRQLLQNNPWGVGLLGFLPNDIYKKQIKTILAHHPTFALIAGGQPDQVKELEAHGISTYIHVPSPGLLKIFLDNGLKRFVFEGRESGGHVGPLCSFSLWETMIELLLEFIALKDSSEGIHVLFAGGIHDALSASMVAVMAAPLAEQGVRIGFQLGSAYLFTEEAVSTGAVVKKYMNEVVGCNSTTLLNMGVGHAVRCVNTPFTEIFKKEKFRLQADGASAEESSSALEKIQLGRLRIASKGMKRKPGSNGGSVLADLTDDEQHLEGMYMVGQLAALRSNSFSIDELHSDILINGSEKIDQLHKNHIGILPYKEEIRPSDIAIVGMSCLLPNASDVKQYWENIINKVSAIREIPEERWNIELYFHENPRILDKVYSKWGAFLDDVYFDPVRFGMPPNSLPSIEPLQLLALEVARNGLKDAGYDQRSFPRERTSVIFGISGVGEQAQQYSFKTALPGFFGGSSPEIMADLDHMLPQWTEDSFPGLLMNVTSGRIANRLDLGGTNFTVDSACASSLTAVYLSVRELESKNSDMVIVGGADCMQNPFTYMCFARTQALSPRGCCNALDERADGIVLGEGLAVMVLKRLADAERDGDHIYSVIKGVGASSDGRDKSLTAPGKAGQVRALNRAYAKACFSPDTVELIEAHATGTSVGDSVELGSIGEVFKAAGTKHRSCAVGTIKSMIGHTKSTAGIASLIKTALALKHKVLPPTLGVEKPNAILLDSDTPFYVNTETRPWIHSNPDHPRRAGVSAFGFGGTNFHVVLEEYKDNFLEQSNVVAIEKWHSELIVIQGKSRDDLLNNVKELEVALAKGAQLLLGDLAYTYALKNEQAYAKGNASPLTLAVIASSLDDLASKLKSATEAISDHKPVVSDPRGIYFTEQGLAKQGKIAFLFPGQGSQYTNMLADLAIQYDEVRKIFENSDLILKEKFAQPLSTFIFPPPVFTDEDKQACEKALEQTCIAQPAIGTANLAIFHVLTSLGVIPDMVAGHSYGEYVALHVACVLSKKDLILLSEARGRIILEATGGSPGTMAAVQTDVSTVDKVIQKINDVWVANLNAPNLTIISGSESGIKEALAKFSASNIKARIIPVACAFHSPIVAPSCERFKNFLSGITFGSPTIKVFSNTDPIIYSDDPQAISGQLVRHLTSRVDFVRQIEDMYKAGARIFVEAGPGRVLSGLVDKILGDRPHLSVISDQQQRSGLLQIQHMMGQLIAHGVVVNARWIYKGRSLKPIDLKTLNHKTGQLKISPTSWVVNGYSAKPLHKMAGVAQKMPIKPVKLNMVSDKTSIDKTRTESMQENTHKKPNPGTVNTLQNSSRDQNKGMPISRQGHISGKNSSKVMLKFQEVMQQFLDVQKNVLSSYFQGAGHVSDTDRRFRNNALPDMLLNPSYVSTSPDQIKSHYDNAEKTYADEKQVQPSIAPEKSMKQDVSLPGEKTGYDRDRLT